GMDGVEVCQRVRANPELRHLYLIILTARAATDDVAEGLNAGADDYIVKPFNRKELQARLQVGIRVVQLQADLARRVQELEESIKRERHLRGLLPICSYCKKIRNDRNYWQQVEQYISEHSEAAFSHGICPDCYRTVVQPQLDALDSAAPGPPSER
ncbi:MAG: response regulator, partial [Candidatus Latescibacterota bacterium]